MKYKSLAYLRHLFLFFLLFFASTTFSFASHIYGVDIGYTWVSGNTYTITMAIYGDCSAASSIFNSLYTATPEIQIYNGSSLYNTVSLNPGSPQGVEVTPVCASQANNTACHGGTIPGVRKFIYSANVTLSGASANWKFHYDGQNGSAAGAGRSSSIMNINPGSIIAVDATLNNSSVSNNSSVTYTTIPTPFFCVNKPASFNPGAVDPNGDSLSFALVAGTNSGYPGPSSPVVYSAGVSATNPLYLTASTSLVFSNGTGQMNFTPAAQQSLVVYTVSEYRNGVLVGTSQREMTFVVLNNCNTSPPRAGISNAVGTGVSIIDSTDVNACSSQGSFTFQVNPTDSSGANITITSAGLPSGATFSVTNNASATPHGTFSWNTTGVTPGTYTFYLTLQDDNCPLSSKQTIAYTVNVLPSPSNVFNLVSAATCVKKAVFTITPGGGSPYQIKVLQGATILQTINNVTGSITDSLQPGTYTIRVINTNSCYKDTSVTLAPPPVIIPSVTMTLPLCPGASTGSITLTANGGLSPFLYAINGGSFVPTNVFNNLASAAYTMHIKDANSCIKDTTVLLQDAPPILSTINITSPTCNNFTNGSITVSGYNTYFPYTYAFGSGTYSSTNTFGSLGAGSYTIHIKDAHGCIKDTVIVLSDSLQVSATFSLTNILCHGNLTGSIATSAFGGFGNYTYAINSGSYGSTSSFNNLAANVYTIHIKDDHQCHLDTNITLTQPAAIAVAPNITNILCYGNNTGQIVANTTGGVTPYSFSINGGSYGSINTFSSLAAGSYIISVLDFNNCVKNDTLAVTTPNPLAITGVVVANATCNNVANGSLTVTLTGGTTPYSYAVNAGSYGSSSVVGFLAAGTYTLHVKDANGCTKDSASFTITQPTAIIPSATVVNSTCHTLANGHVTLSATGGTPGYTYSIAAGAYSSSPSFTSVAAGTYTFHIKDANNCIKDTILTITDSLNVIGTIAITRPTCYSYSNGMISISGSGGTNPYTYAMGINPYSSATTFSNITAGIYTMHIKDANGCVKDTNITVTQPAVIAPQVAITEPSCYNDSNGSVTVSATGGTPAYQYAFGSIAYSSNTLYSNLKARTDTVYVRDNNGCSHDTSFTIGQPTALLIDSIKHENIKCNGGNNGWIQVYASGAVPPYAYSVNAGTFQSSSLLSGLFAGSEAVVIKDNHNCPVDTSIKLSQPSHLAFIVDSVLNPTCEAFKDGYFAYHAAGGTPYYEFAMADTNTFSSQMLYTHIAEGNYLFYIKDSNNCVYDTPVQFIGYPHIVIENIGLKNPACYNLLNGKVTLDVTGGMQPLSYQLAGVTSYSPSPVFDSLPSGTYKVLIVDSKNCMKDSTVALVQPDSMKITPDVTPNDCNGIDNSGVVNVTVVGGTPPYNYLWSANPEATGTSVTGMPNGNYMVWVHDANNCADSLLSIIGYDDCCKPFIPSAFTPNGDGIDDYFRVRFKGDMKLISLSIYNRFGQRVYHSVYIDQGWDGTYDGVPLDLGVYEYFVKAICGNKGDHIVEMKGDVTLIR